MFDSSLDAFSIHSAGHHMLANPAYLALFGFDSFDALEGTPVTDVIAPEERSRVTEIIRQRALGMGASSYVTKGLRRDGSSFDLEVHASSFSLDDEKFVVAILRDVTKSIVATDRLREDEQRFRTLFDLSPDPAWLIEDNRFTECNAAAMAILGYPDKTAFLFVHPSRLSPECQPCGEASFTKAERMMALARERGIHRFEWTHTRADGTDFPAEVTLSAITLQGRQVIYCIWRDISVPKHMEHALQASERRFHDFTFASADWIWETDDKGRFTYVAGNVESVLGYSPAELIGRTPFDLMPPDEAIRVRAIMKEIVNARSVFSDLRNINLHRDGSLQHASTTGTPIVDSSGRFLGYRGIDRDITALQEKDDRIVKLAYHDLLTGLPNRLLLEDRVNQALLAGRRSGSKTALLFLDLDRFKVINDSLGHDVGDQLLGMMSERMLSMLRRSDTLSRLGGDEFVVMLTDIDGGEEVIRVAEKIIAEVSRPIQLQGHELTIGVSIGAAMAPDDGDTFHALLKNADTAMYRAKDEGKSTFRFFDSSMNVRLVGNLHMEARLRKAIENGEMELHYQPKIRLHQQRPYGAEALARWRLDGEMVPPVRFIPLAEETGLITALGDLVLTMALDRIAAWRTEGLAVPRVAINLSARQFGDRSLVDRILRMVADRGLSPADLELELTESLMMADLDRAEAMLGRLHAEGFVIALDDFGTGYSSLGYLKRLPIDCVKIDRSFVRDIGTDRRDEALVDAILAMGRSLGLAVVAEGVENQQQLDFLVARGCTEYQGYLFSKPLPPDEFRLLLAPATE